MDIYFFYSEDYSCCCFSPPWGDIGSHSLGEPAVPPTAIRSLLPPLGTRLSGPQMVSGLKEHIRSKEHRGLRLKSLALLGPTQLKDVEGGSNQRSRPSCLLPH